MLDRYSTLSILLLVVHVAYSITIKSPSPEPAPLSIQLFSATTPKPDLDVSLRLELNPSWKILGGGATTKIANKTLLSATYPVNAYTWFARAYEDVHKTPSYLTISVVAIYDPKNLLDHKIFIGKSLAAVPAPNATATVADGYTLTGGGAVVTDVADFTAFIYATYPNASNTWISHAYFPQKNGTAFITSYAIGIKPLSKSVTIIGETVGQFHNDSYPYANDGPVATLYNYNDNTRITGGGAYVNYRYSWDQGGGNFLWQSMPVLDIYGERVVGWTAAGKDHTSGVITVYFVAMTIKSQPVDEISPHNPRGG